MSLEKILHAGKKFLRTAVLTATLISPTYAQQTPTKIPVNNNSWSSEIPVESVGHNKTETLGASSSFLSKDKTLSYIHLDGSITPENTLAIRYYTTDPKNPSKGAPTISARDTKIYLLCEPDTTISHQRQTINGFLREQFKNNIEATPIDQATSTLVTLGNRVVESAKENDPTGAFISSHSGGLVNISVSDLITKLDTYENKAGRRMRSQIGQQSYDLIPISMQLYDKSDASQLRETGRNIEVRLQAYGKEKVRTAILFQTRINNASNTERGSVQAYTDFFIAPATQIQQPQSGINGVWWSEKASKEAINSVVIHENRIYLMVPVPQEEVEKVNFSYDANKIPVMLTIGLKDGAMTFTRDKKPDQKEGYLINP